MAATKITITKKDIEERADNILISLSNFDELSSGLLIKQLASWPSSKRRQLFRILFKSLFYNSNGFTQKYLVPVIKSRYLDGNRWFSMDATHARSKMLMFIIEYIQDMENAKDFIPEKTLTIPEISLNRFSIEPEILKYLLDKGIIVFSDKFNIKTRSSNIITDLVYSAHYNHPGITPYNAINQHCDLKKDLSSNIDKNTSKLLANVIINMEIVFDHLVSSNTITPGKCASILSALNTVHEIIKKPLHGYLSRKEFLFRDALKKNNIFRLDTHSRQSLNVLLSNKTLELSSKIYKYSSALSNQMGDSSRDSSPGTFDPFTATI